MSTGYHEGMDALSPETRDIHRALASLMEELEAVDWYQQRMDVTDDAQLRAVLEHNRNEEIEHAAMVLEWLRRRIPKFDEELRTYLFTTVDITEVEEAAEAATNGEERKEEESPIGLGIRSLKKGE